MLNSWDEPCLAGLAKNQSGITLSWFRKDVTATPGHAEAKALYLAISLAASRSWRKVFITSDSLELVRAVNDNYDIPWEAALAIDYIKSSLSTF